MLQRKLATNPACPRAVTPPADAKRSLGIIIIIMLQSAPGLKPMAYRLYRMGAAFLRNLCNVYIALLGHRHQVHIYLSVVVIMAHWYKLRGCASPT